MAEIGRNDRCHCGSGKKYKKCHLDKDEKKAAVVRRFKQGGFSRADLFISGKYKKCPRCPGSRFGVQIGTGGDGYTRECAECGYTQGIPLPALKKKIIYLDQFLISNMAKVLDPGARSHAVTSQQPFWLEAYKKADRLLSLNLAIFPDSTFHTDESLLSGDPSHKTLRAVYERLSHGNTFYDHDTITRFQLHEHLENYLDGNPEKPLTFDPEKVIHGHPHEWLGRLRVGVNMRPYPGQIDAIKKERDNLYETIKPIFGRWQDEKGRDFMEWVREEANAFGKGTVQAYLKYLKKRTELPQKYAEQMLAGQEPDIALEDILPNAAAQNMDQIQYVLRTRGITEPAEALQKTAEYLQSPHMINLPTNHISALLYAGIARKAAHGQKATPNKGTFADVNAISSLLPYCDAIFIDNAMAALLAEHPIAEEVARYGTRIFSPNTKDEFLAYLDEIEATASAEHLALVDDAYGETWLEPNLSILDNIDDD